MSNANRRKQLADYYDESLPPSLWEGEGGGNEPSGGDSVRGSLYSGFSYYTLGLSLADHELPLSVPPWYHPNVVITIDGISLGRYEQSDIDGNIVAGQCSLNDPVSHQWNDQYFSWRNADDFDNRPILEPLDTLNVLLAWEWYD